MSSNLTDISGVGPDTANLLMEHNLKSPSEIASASIKRLCAIPSIGTIRAGRLIKAAKELLAVSNQGTSKVTASKATAATATKAATRPRRTTTKAKAEATTLQNSSEFNL